MNPSLLERLKSIDNISAITIDQYHEHILYLFTESEPNIKKIRDQIIKTFESIVQYSFEDVMMFDREFYTLSYASLESMTHQLNRTLFEQLPKDSCTTCQWHHLLYDHLQFDRCGRYEALRNRFTLPFKDRLTKRIIEQDIIYLSEQPRSLYMRLIDAYHHQQSLGIMRLTPRYIEIIIDMWFSIKKETYGSVDNAINTLHQSHHPIDQDIHHHITILISMDANLKEKESSCISLVQIIKREVSHLKIE